MLLEIHMKKSVLLTAAILFSGVLVAHAQEHDQGHHEHEQHEHKHHAAHMTAAELAQAEKSANVILLDSMVRDQTGHELAFASEVIGDRVVVIDFIFTSCTTICPVTTSLLQAARTRLSDIDQDQLVFVSVSINSNVDTPQRLATFAARHGAEWSFITGDKTVLDELLQNLNSYSTNPEDHAPMILVGDAASGQFSRMFGLPDPERVERHVRAMIEKRSADAHESHGSHHHHPN